METIRKLKISNQLCLHARAAAKIVELANQYSAKLFLSKGNQEVSGSNILSILTLSGQKGTEIMAKIVGNDSEVFMRELSKLFEKKFGEGK